MKYDEPNEQLTSCPGCIREIERWHWSRHGQLIEDFLDDRLAGLLLRFGFIGDGDAVAEHIHADAFDVLGRDVAAAFEEGVSLGGEGQRDSRARRGAQL